VSFILWGCKSYDVSFYSSSCSNTKPYLQVVRPVPAHKALTTESWRHNHNISTGGNVCAVWLKSWRWRGLSPHCSSSGNLWGIYNYFQAWRKPRSTGGTRPEQANKWRNSLTARWWCLSFGFRSILVCSQKHCVQTNIGPILFLSRSTSISIHWFVLLFRGVATLDVGFPELCRVASRGRSSHDLEFWVGITTLGVATLSVGLPASCLRASLRSSTLEILYRRRDNRRRDFRHRFASIVSYGVPRLICVFMAFCVGVATIVVVTPGVCFPASCRVGSRDSSCLIWNLVSASRRSPLF
jgi:hypothetical protein